MAPRSPYGSATARSTLALRRATMPRLSSPRREPLRSGSARPATRSSTCLLPCSVFRPCRYRCSRSTGCRWDCKSPALSVRTPCCSRWRPRSAICWAQRLRLPRFSSEAWMRFGWLTLSLSPSPEEDADRIDQQIEQVRFAERLGFGDVWLTEHYFTGESVYNDALLFASAVAMRTERIRIGFAVVQLPFHHPVRLAVQLALLDNLSKGRIDVGVGKGTIYNEYEFVGHGLRSDDSRERMEEAVDIIGRLWGGGPVTYNGKYFQVQVPQLRPRPVQRPYLPLWRGVISPSSFSECGRLGVPILTARLPVARIKERRAAYEAGLDAGGHDAATKARLPAGAECAVAQRLCRRIQCAGGGRAIGSAAADSRPYDACPRRVQPGRFHHRPGDAEPLGRSRSRRRRGGQIRARHRVALRLTRAGPRSGDRVARCRRAAPVVPDRLWRHEPRPEPRLDAPLWRGGDAGIPNLRR